MDVKNASEIDEQQEIDDFVLSYTLDNVNTLSDLEIYQFVDDRGYSLLMLAAERGHNEAVQHLIERAEDVDYEVCGESAASLAFAGGHYETVLILLKANSKFPTNYKREIASNELNNYFEMCNQLHSKINSNDLEGVEDTISSFPMLRYFYNSSNDSLLKCALLKRNYLLCKSLIEKNLLLGPHETVKEIVENFSEDDRETFNEFKIISDMQMVFLRNCKFITQYGFGPMFTFAREAFKMLSTVNSLESILQIVAETRKLRIIFDTNRDSLNTFDTQSEPYGSGQFYINNKIYVAAKDLLDPENTYKVVALLAHELCHYAMFICYENRGNPYRADDSKQLEAFENINSSYKELRIVEPLIDSVYSCYPEEMQHAELVVRVPHMLVLYKNDPIYLNILRKTYEPLFNFYEDQCIPEMQRRLPMIEEKYQHYIEKRYKVDYLKKLSRYMSCVIIFIILMQTATIFYIFKPNYSWESLSEAQKIEFKNSIVNYHGVDVKIGELFSNDSEVYNLLPSEHIRFGLEGNYEFLSKALRNLYSSKIYWGYSNMTERLRINFLSRNVNFQGKNVEIKEILSNFKVLRILNSSQILQTFEGFPIEISTATKSDAKFYIERFFIDEKLKIEAKHYENDKINENHPEILNFPKVLSEVEEFKIFLLSSLAGEGKSTTFRHFSMKLKKKFPQNWVQFVDLKKYFQSFKIGMKHDLNQPKELLKFLTSNLLNLNEFESEIFKELFNSNRVIFLWDGVDEISPYYKDFMLDLTSAIKSSSKCFQLISTRPQFMRDFVEKLGIKGHTFIPFDKKSQIEFLAKTTSSEKTKKILHTIEKSGKSVTNPLLLQMITEILLDDDYYENLDLYSTYEQFINKKLGIVRHEKGEIVGKITEKILVNSQVNLMQVHQAFALKLIFNQEIVNNLKIMEHISKLSYVDISRFGILTIDSENKFSFFHPFFAHFLVARFLIDTFENDVLESSDRHIKISLLRDVLLNEKFSSIRKFIEVSPHSKGEFLRFWHSNVVNIKNEPKNLIAQIMFSLYFKN